MLTKRYVASTKNVGAIFKKIQEGTAPDKFTVPHLKGLGFRGSNDRGIIPLMKDLGFLDDSSQPTQAYRNYRNTAKARTVMGAALKHAYGDLFHISALPTESNRREIHGKFKSAHNVTDAVADKLTATFFSLLKLADLKGAAEPLVPSVEDSSDEDSAEEGDLGGGEGKPSGLSLRYNIQIHLPPSKDVEVYNAIFKSLKEHLID